MRDGHSLVLDTPRRHSATDQMFVLWNINGVVVDPLEVLPGAKPPRVRLLSANPDYPPLRGARMSSGGVDATADVAWSCGLPTTLKGESHRTFGRIRRRLWYDALHTVVTQVPADQTRSDQ